MYNRKSKTEYTEISSAKVTKNRHVVISDCSSGGFTIAQKMDVIEDSRITSIFLKGAFHVDDIHGLYELRDACNLAIQIVEDREKDNVEWD